jgi:hypothetical protein
MIQLLTQIANQVGISSSLLLSICTVESNLKNINNYLDNVEPSFGVCQVQLSTARTIMPYVDSLALQRPRINALIAAMYIKRLEMKYDLLSEVVSAYNRGSIKRINGKLSNQKYVDNVLTYYYTIYEQN